MKTIRAVTGWINRHRRISLVIVIVTAAAVWFIRINTVHSRGELTAPLVRGPIVESVYGIGIVKASQSFQIRPGLTTTITAIYVKEGDTVKKDDPLIRLDAVTYQAPFDATVTYLPFKVGENVYTQTALSLVDLNDRYLVVSMEQQGALKVRPGQGVKISFDGMRDNAYGGRVQSVYSYQNTFLARIAVEGLPSNILPDMSADVAIEIGRSKDALIIPVAALEHGEYVWRKRGTDVIRKIQVSVGAVDRAAVEITAGDVLPGDRLLIRKDMSK